MWKSHGILIDCKECVVSDMLGKLKTMSGNQEESREQHRPGKASLSLPNSGPLPVSKGMSVTDFVTAWSDKVNGTKLESRRRHCIFLHFIFKCTHPISLYMSDVTSNSVHFTKLKSLLQWNLPFHLQNYELLQVTKKISQLFLTCACVFIKNYFYKLWLFLSPYLTLYRSHSHGFHVHRLVSKP